MKGITMHKLLTDIFEEHPGKTVHLALGRYPHVPFDRATMEVTTNLDAPLDPAQMAEIINSLITESDGAFLKKRGTVGTRINDEFYQRDVKIVHNPKEVVVEITSRLLKDIEAENNKLIAASDTMALIKG